MTLTLMFACIQAFCLFLFIGNAQACSASGLLSCLNTFQNDLGITSAGDTSYLSNLGAAERASILCGSYQTYKLCFDLNIQGCNIDDTASKVFFYTDEMYGYLCNAGREDYVKYSDCWFESSVETEIADCLVKYTLTGADAQAICPYINNILGCSGDIVYNRCGRDAATVYSTFNAYAQLMAYQLVSCPSVKNTYASASNNPYKTGSRTPNGYTPMTPSVAVVLSAFLVAAYEYLNFV